MAGNGGWGEHVEQELAVVRDLVRQELRDSGCSVVERVPVGASTRVYRVRQAQRVLYLRVLPEDGASFAPEAMVHRLLRTRGVSVPEVVYLEHHNPVLLRSVMVTTEIPGAAVGYGAPPPNLRGILAKAGRDLATINSVPVCGFGWIRRDSGVASSLEAEFATRQAWIRQEIDDYLDALLRTNVIRRRDAQAVGEVVRERGELLGSGQSYLAHGDFDVTHIYHQRGEYTGIIDFGEIRGADQAYDLGHFQIECHAWLPYLLEGYGEQTRLPPDHQDRIQASSLFIALSRLGRGLLKGRTPYPPDVEAIQRAISFLLT
jgi:aminoglycoside phosphotransferase (APT) family kinase protein